MIELIFRGSVCLHKPSTRTVTVLAPVQNEPGWYACHATWADTPAGVLMVPRKELKPLAVLDRASQSALLRRVEADLEQYGRQEG